MTSLLDTLRSIVGDAHVLTEGDLTAWEQDWRRRVRGKALAVSILKASVKDTDGNDVDVAEFFGEAEAPESAETEAKADENDAEK